MQEREVVRRVTRISPASVFRTALAGCFAGYLAFVVMCATLWGIASAFGVGTNVENFFGNLISSDDFHILSGPMLVGVVVTGAALAALGALVCTIGATTFNLVADLTGGVDVVSVEEGDPSQATGPRI